MCATFRLRDTSAAVICIPLRPRYETSGEHIMNEISNCIGFLFFLHLFIPCSLCPRPEPWPYHQGRRSRFVRRTCRNSRCLLPLRRMRRRRPSSREFYQMHALHICAFVCSLQMSRVSNCIEYHMYIYTHLLLQTSVHLRLRCLRLYRSSHVGCYRRGYRGGPRRG